MSPLRQQMIDLMTVKNFSPSTCESYLFSMIALVKYFRRPPDELTQEDIQNYLIYLVKDRRLSPNSCRLYLQGILFFYRQVLGWPAIQIRVHYPKRPQRIPELLTQSEVKRILEVPDNLKHQTMLKTSYSTGVRISELLALKVSDIDSERMLLRIDQGKGAKDRLIPLSSSLLYCLRKYWCSEHPTTWLFPGWKSIDPVHQSTINRVFKESKRRAGIKKKGGIHSLRHAYATHSLEQGMPVHLLQRWLGHTDIRTTLRYVHWVPAYKPGEAEGYDLLAE